MLGLFDASHIPYNIDMDHSVKPTLEEMVSKALDVLEKDQKGYFLFVEGIYDFFFIFIEGFHTTQQPK